MHRFRAVNSTLGLVVLETVQKQEYHHLDHNRGLHGYWRHNNHYHGYNLLPGWRHMFLYYTRCRCLHELTNPGFHLFWLTNQHPPCVLCGRDQSLQSWGRPGSHGHPVWLGDATWILTPASSMRVFVIQPYCPLLCVVYNMNRSICKSDIYMHNKSDHSIHSQHPTDGIHR